MPPSPPCCPIPNSGGDVGPTGPVDADICFLGEAAGATEAIKGTPFCGPAGGQLDRIIAMLGWDRSKIRIGNRRRCFPGSTIVEAQGIERGYRRWYSGPLVRIHTRFNDLAATPNHPILTAAGWKAAGQITQGDYLVCGEFNERMRRGNPHINQGPISFEEAFDSLSLGTVSQRVVGSNMDFHGDGGDTEVEIVTTNGLLRERDKSTLLQHLSERILKSSNVAQAFLSRLGITFGNPLALLQWDGASSRSSMGGSYEALALAWTQQTPTIVQRPGAVPHVNATDFKLPLNPSLANMMSLRQSCNTSPRQIGLAEVVDVSTEAAFCGHVYNLQTASHQFIAQGFIVSNCHPPGDWLVGAPWENSPCQACDDGFAELLAEPHKVFVTLGGTALRAALGLKRDRGKEPVKLDNFHGAPIQDAQGRWIVATYHPSFLMQGGQRFVRTVCYDLSVAADVAKPGWQPTRREMISDPPPAWFEAWVEETIARAEVEDVWLSVDFETLEKEKETDEGELRREGGKILWVNLATDPRVGITCVWGEPYRRAVVRLLQHPRIVKIFHNAPFDVAAAEEDGIAVAEPIYDFMDAWHCLHPTLKRGLGFVTPFYSSVGPWKHLGIADSRYRCLDATETLGNAFGIAEDLTSQGMWGIYYRHCYQLDRLALRPATKIGLPFNRERLEIFRGELEIAETRLIGDISGLVPETICRLDGPYVTAVAGWNVERLEEKLVQCCSGCGAQEVTKSHRCADRAHVPAVSLAPRTVTRYYRRQQFNPASWQQVLAYIKAKGHKPGKAKKTKKDTTDKKTLNRLIKTGDPFYALTLEHRQVNKMKGTYCDGILERMDSGGRVHGEFGHVPYSMRLNSTSPNLQNLSSHVKYADGFRRCIEAADGCRLVSLDYSGAEAVDIGWWQGDPDYIRLARLGVHAYVTGHTLAQEGKIEPPSLKWSDYDLGSYFVDIKARFDPAYQRGKRCVLGVNYGLTAFGMADYFPETFPKKSDAEKIIGIYFEVCPKLKPYHAGLRQFTHDKKFIGGPAPEGADYWTLTRGIRNPRDLASRIYHPFGYRCEFYGVLQYRKEGGQWKEYLGEDAKKVVAWPSQSSTAGHIAEAALRLYDPEITEDYIGDLWHGRTPLRAIIHDELLNEVPMGRVDELLEKGVRVMTSETRQMPMPTEWGLGNYLKMGVSAKVGRNWAPFHPIENPDGMKKVSVETLMGDVWREEEEEEEES